MSDSAMVDEGFVGDGDDDVIESLEVSKLISEVEKAGFDARLSELQVARHEIELLEAKINLDYQLGGEYSFSRAVNQRSAKHLARTMRIWHRHLPNGAWAINLNSVGGEIQHGAALFDEIYSHSLRGGGTHHVTIKVRGLAASMAGILLQAADDRVIGRSSQIMVHESQGGVIGGHSEITQEADWHRRWRDYMLEVFLSRSDVLTRAQLLKRIANGRQWYLSADEALAVGFVDRIG